MDWLAILVAGLFEVAFAVCLKLSDGLSRLWPTVGFLIASLMSFVFLSYAIKTIPIGNAYVVWTGIGAVGTTIVGILAFQEPSSLLRYVGIALVIAGISVLNIHVAVAA
ncbi:MAG: multidrug efflux SMR transporter [Actinomycetes bacterium]